MMISTNGKIPAGSVPLSVGSLALDSPETRMLSIEKCPDRNAKVEFSISIEFVRQSVRNNSSTQNQNTSRLDFEPSIRRSRMQTSVGFGNLSIKTPRDVH